MENYIDRFLSFLGDLFGTLKVWITKLFSWGEGNQMYLIYALLIYLASKIFKVKIKLGK